MSGLILPTRDGYDNDVEGGTTWYLSEDMSHDYLSAQGSSAFSTDDFNPFSVNADSPGSSGGDTVVGPAEHPGDGVAVGVEHCEDQPCEQLVGDGGLHPGQGGTSSRFRHGMKKLQSCLVNSSTDSGTDARNAIPQGFRTSGHTRFQSSTPPNALSFQQAVVLLEDAAFYRSINHSLKDNVLVMYRIYHSRLIAFARYLAIAFIHLLAFIEEPSSLSISSDLNPRRHIRVIHVPPNVLLGVELFLLLCFGVDVFTKWYLIGTKQFGRSKWLIVYLLVVVASIVDWSVDVGYIERIRFRRILRPFFLLQNSSLLKKTVHCLQKSLPEVLAILCLLLLHIYIFSLIFLLIFPYDATTIRPSTNDSLTSNNSIEGKPPDLEEAFFSLFVLLTTANNPDVTMPLYRYARPYVLFFICFLLVGLYCFMNMLTAVIYNQFRGYFLTSMQASHLRRLVALRASFEVMRHLAPDDGSSSSSSDLSDSFAARSRPASKFVPPSMLRDLVTKANLRNRNQSMILDRIDRLPIQPGYSCSQFMKLFDLMDFHPLPKKPTLVSSAQPVTRALQFVFQHHWYTLFGNMVTMANVICITIELLQPVNKALSVSSPLYVWNMVFVVYYIADLILKIWAKGWALYMWSTANVYEGFITILIIIVEAFHIMEFGFPNERGGDPVPIWNIGLSFHVVVRIANILIILRLLRVLADLKAFNLVASAIYDLFLNLTPFAGILVVMYYTFAIVGMELFRGAIQYDSFGNSSFPIIKPAHKCGTYQELGYWPNNFDDFASACVVLWDLMVVNNWHVFLYAYEEVSGKWSKLFFILWFVVSVIIGLNLFTALILENFIMKWDKAHKDALLEQRLRDCADNAGVEYDHDHPHLTVSELDESINHTVHNLFRSNIRDPEETEIMQAVRSHVHLNSLLEDDALSLVEPQPVPVPPPAVQGRSS